MYLRKGNICINYKSLFVYEQSNCMTMTLDASKIASCDHEVTHNHCRPPFNETPSIEEPTLNQYYTLYSAQAQQEKKRITKERLESHPDLTCRHTFKHGTLNNFHLLSTYRFIVYNLQSRYYTCFRLISYYQSHMPLIQTHYFVGVQFDANCVYDKKKLLKLDRLS